MKYKGQIFSSDFLIACTVFVLAFSILYVYWTYATMQIDESQRINDMIDRAYLISEIWFREGTPEYWNETDVVDLGLSNDHRFNWTKMVMMRDDIGYENVSKLIGVEIYDYNFTVYNSTRDLLYSFGIPPSNPEDLIKVKRVGILNGSVAVVEIMVFE